jgi:hypothetical protein
LLAYSVGLTGVFGWLGAEMLATGGQAWTAVIGGLLGAAVAVHCGIGRWVRLRGWLSSGTAQTEGRFRLAGLAQRIDAGLLQQFDTELVRRNQPWQILPAAGRPLHEQFLTAAYNMEQLVTPGPPASKSSPWLSQVIAALVTIGLLGVSLNQHHGLWLAAAAFYLPLLWGRHHRALLQLEALETYLRDAWRTSPPATAAQYPDEAALATAELEHRYGLDLNALQGATGGIARYERNAGRPTHPFSVLWLLVGCYLAMVTGSEPAVHWANAAAVWLGSAGILASDLLLRRGEAPYRAQIREWLERQCPALQIASGELTDEALRRRLPRLGRIALQPAISGKGQQQPAGLRPLLENVARNLSFLANPRPQTVPLYFELAVYFPAAIISFIAGLGFAATVAMQDEGFLRGTALALLLLPLIGLALPMRHAAIKRNLQQGIAAAEFVAQLQRDALQDQRAAPSRGRGTAAEQAAVDEPTLARVTATSLDS